MSEYTTRDILDMIEANGGPQGLDLSGKDLSDIDLSRETIREEVERAQREKPGARPPWLSRPQDTRLARVLQWLSGGEWAGLEEARLGGTNLEGAVFKRANLQRANLRRGNLEGAELWGANLQGANLWGANLEGAHMLEANLEGADLWGTNLEWAYLLAANLEGADLGGANMPGVRLVDTNLKGVHLKDANLSRVDLRDARSIEAMFLYRARLDHTQLTRHQLGEAVGEERDGQWQKAKEAYLALENNFDQIGRYDDASWAYRKERRMEKREAWQSAKQAFSERDWRPVIMRTWKAGWDLVVEHLCDYGESVGRVLFWMGLLLFVVGPLLFGLPGLLRWPPENRDAFYSLRPPWSYAYAYLQQFLYVLDAFTTASFAVLQPATALTRVLSGLTALTGVFLTGLLGFVAGNRIRRS
jgi:uncharacterized protein YjbI with pentapeptide repeats